MRDDSHILDETVGDENVIDPARRRPFIGVHYRCCGVYARVYRRPEQRVYFGRCPRCLRVIRIRVAASGSSARLFEAH